MASQIIKNVIIAGGRGTIGTPVVTALLASGLFNVSVLLRPESSSLFPPSVTVKRVDFASHNDLVAALRGQDALICILNDFATEVQVPLIEAAVAAGVKRFIPSEWGNCAILAPAPEVEPAVEGKAAIVELLRQKAAEAREEGREFHWTGVNNGLFFDWALQVGFIDIIFPTRTATLWDAGAAVFSTTNLSTAAAGVVAILSTAEAETRDRFVNIESFATSQAEIVAALEKATDEKWAVEETSREEQLAGAHEMFDKGEVLGAFYRWILAGVVSGREECRFESVDNEMLGLKREDLMETVEKIVRGEEI